MTHEDPNRLPLLKTGLLYLATALLIQLCLGWPFQPIGGGLEGDRGANLWNLWWAGHSLLDQSPTWSATLFAPDGVHLKGHSLSLANGLLALPATRLLGPVWSYDLLFLLHTWMTLWGFHLWARRRTGLRGAILVALFAACGGLRLSHLMHLNLLSTGAVGWTLWAWDETLEEKPRRAAVFVLGWLFTAFAAWYHGIAIGFYVLVTLLVSVLQQRRVPIRPLLGLAASAAVLSACILLYTWNPTPGVLGLPDSESVALPVAAHWSNGLGDLVLPAWLSARPLGSEWAVHPGWCASILCVLGFLFHLRRKEPEAETVRGSILRDGIVGLAFLSLSLGPVLSLAGHYLPMPAWLCLLLPGFGTMRVYARFAWYGWLMAMPYAWTGLNAAYSRFSPERRGASNAWLVLLVAVLALEGLWPQLIVRAWNEPRASEELGWVAGAIPRASLDDRRAVLELPVEPSRLEGVHLARQTIHQRPLLTGELSRYTALRRELFVRYPFLDPTAWRPGGDFVALGKRLTEANVGFVVLDIRRGEPWRSAALGEPAEVLRSMGIEVVPIGDFIE